MGDPESFIAGDVSVLKLGPGANSASSSARSLLATLEKPRRLHPLSPLRERWRRTTPAQRLDLLKERRIGAQGREFLEEQCELALFAENLPRKVLDLTVAIQNSGGGPGTDSRNAGVAVGRVAHEREQVRNELRADTELFAYPCGIANGFAPAVDLHHARASHALRQIFIGRPDRDALDLPVLRREMRGRSERIIGQTTTPIAASASSSGWNCASSAGSMPSPVL
jgi:hypothetical protein